MKKEVKLIRMSTNGNNRRDSDKCKEVMWTVEERSHETLYYTEEGKVYIRKHKE